MDPQHSKNDERAVITTWGVIRGTPSLGNWVTWVVVLAILTLTGAVLYPLMSSRVEQRETECKQHCIATGHPGYRYTPPRGGSIRGVRIDECMCIN
jgi:hypothetical protein